MNIDFLSTELRFLIEMALISHGLVHDGRFWLCAPCRELRDDLAESIALDFKLAAVSA